MKKTDFIVQDLLSKIYQGAYNLNKLPNQRKLASSYKVSRFTIQKAIADLVDMGIISTIQGSGIFINKKALKNPLIFNSLTKTPYKRLKSKMLSLEKRKANSKDQQIFQIEPNSKVWVFERIRIVNYKIEQLEYSVMPCSLFFDLNQSVIEGSIQQYVESKGLKISHHITSYIPTISDEHTSHILLCRKGTPMMKIINRSVLNTGRVFEYSEIAAIDYSVTYIRPYNREGQNFRAL
ncbi:MAG: GntR family transcriptional regulator [Lactobacillus helsingborgensis]|nr:MULTISPECIES: GntR family transcriptional regulator [Lactobacillus]AWN34181.1 GntR family transcriptional regulator [Lactobacillus helsingborgensis]MCT6812135.1 GntR family transcriptional regulator [Lactobacillus helsingborgensis]MCT6828581.1 GntR family transcriptional regulator [Lactobacillus helsingborgensis]MCT6847833.1 GntR family transcriptional regulator [Lactobacillus helsingborgensis]RMC52582.1 GntR family transcriptional regulator [Lactobacillus sp. ESL0262]